MRPAAAKPAQWPDAGLKPHLYDNFWTYPGFVDSCAFGISRPDVAACCPPVSSHSLVRPLAAPFFRPDPRDGAASRGAAVKDGREHGGRLMCVGISRCRLTPSLKVHR